MTALEQFRRRERAESLRAALNHPAVLGTIAGVTLMLILLRVFS